MIWYFLCKFFSYNYYQIKLYIAIKANINLICIKNENSSIKSKY